MSKYYRVYANVNIDAIKANVRSLRANTSLDTKAMAVVKADGYGHGDVAVAKAVEDLVDAYAVATLDEAVNLRENGIDKLILILGYVDPSEYETLVANEIDATIFDVDTAKSLNEVAKKCGKKAFCHIKIDTGMRRIGFEPNEDSVEQIKQIKALENINARGIFTHFATADESSKENALKQYEKFNWICERLNNEGVDFEIRHCANSAAIIDLPQTNKDMVRLGIALYGMYPSEEVVKENVVLQPALELKSHITMIKTISTGQPVGYGGTYVTDRETVVATISVGYGDGYPRALSSKGNVIIKGQRVPIIGRVCMDQMMVDVTDIEGVSRNDVVTLVGKDGDEEITVEEISEIAGTFNYEFVCDLGKRIPRQYFMDGKYIGSHDYFHEKWELENI